MQETMTMHDLEYLIMIFAVVGISISTGNIQYGCPGLYIDPIA